MQTLSSIRTKIFASYSHNDSAGSIRSSMENAVQLCFWFDKLVFAVLWCVEDLVVRRSKLSAAIYRRLFLLLIGTIKTKCLAMDSFHSSYDLHGTSVHPLGSCRYHPYRWYWLREGFLTCQVSTFEASYFSGFGSESYKVIRYMMLPSIVSAVPLFVILTKLRLINIWWALILSHLIIIVPLGVWFLISFSRRFLWLLWE